MAVIGFWLAGLWALFPVYWLASAMRAKRNVAHSSQQRGAVVRLLVVAAAILLWHQAIVVSRASLLVGGGPLLAIGGVLLTALGIAFAIWARWHLGRNWGMPMAHKENPDLVTSGPYRLIRHPIYSGLLLALAGTMLATSWWLLGLLGLVAAYFVYSAVMEERMMTRLFPQTYPAYQARSQMLVPFVF